ncbi:hypothetical protein [Thalassomonas sp. RHCl1]|uniref:hypothetical protein n=1 Tax=Thalassomonas sp. RHCl1 TaxID=2995320 RepID=UPI00248AF1D8|nr:hypothetical protein [Thalassomonas sp. RHCl1]
MNEKYRRILMRMAELEEELLEELHKQEQRMREQIEDSKVIIQHKVEDVQQELKVHVLPWLLNCKIRNLASAPFIYAVAVPLFFLDICLCLYQLICFPLYGIPKVKRQKYFIFDRHRLDYLNVIEKFNCLYCGYANGVIAFAREIASRTEQYWCPIKHRRKRHQPHQRYGHFIDYGDGENYRRKAKHLREQLKDNPRD